LGGCWHRSHNDWGYFPVLRLEQGIQRPEALVDGCIVGNKAFIRKSLCLWEVEYRFLLTAPGKELIVQVASCIGTRGEDEDWLS
jgi:hypothetical protein